MSDTANPASHASAPLASATEFDARLKRTDEDRWLATRYAPGASRRRLVAILLLHQELQRSLHVREPMLGKVRLQWWRETLDQVAGPGPVRRHDLAEELVRVTRDRRDLLAPLNALVDRFDDVLDDHLRAGHTDDAGHAERHLAAEGALMRLAGLALDAHAKPQDLDLLASAGELRLAFAAGLTDAPGRWAAARQAVRRLPSALWPAILHLATVQADARQLSPLARRWRVFRAALTRRI